MELKTVMVPAIGCNGCVQTIKSEVGQIPGVTEVQGDPASKQITVKWNEPATWQVIEQKLVEIEYPPSAN